MQDEQLPLTGEQGRVFLLTSPLIGSSEMLPHHRHVLEVFIGDTSRPPAQEEFVFQIQPECTSSLVEDGLAEVRLVTTEADR